MSDRLIKLTCDCFVAASEIAEVTVNLQADTITVRTKRGIGHVIGADYGRALYETADRLRFEINAALADP